MRHVRRLSLAVLSSAALALSFVAFSSAFSSPPAAAAGTGCLPGVLKSRLAEVRRKFGNVQVISAHRRGATIAGSGRRSYHASCRAVDFKAPSGKHRQVVAWLKQNHGGGVGTYSCGMHHIHIDNGPHVRFHHCVSASGRPKKSYARRGGARKYASRGGSGRRSVRVVGRSPSSTRRGAGVARRAASAGAQGFSALGHFTRSTINGG